VTLALGTSMNSLGGYLSDLILKVTVMSLGSDSQHRPIHISCHLKCLISQVVALRTLIGQHIGSNFNSIPTIFIGAHLGNTVAVYSQLLFNDRSNSSSCSKNENKNMIVRRVNLPGAQPSCIPA
jgi:hypothetical protein